MKSIRISFTSISLIALLGVSCIAFVAQAQEPETETVPENDEVRMQQSERPEDRATSTAERQEMRAAREAEMIERRASTTAAREERKAALSARLQERITNLAANMSNRMEAVVVRFEQIIERLQSRITKLEASGIDTAAAQRELENAKTAHAAAQSSLATIDTAVAETVGSDDPKTAWQALRATYTQIRTDLTTTHEALRATVAALKEALANSDRTGVRDAVSNSEQGDREPTEEASSN